MLRKRDVLLIVCALALSALLLALLPKGEGAYAVIEYDGAVAERILLAGIGEGETKTYTVNGVTIEADRHGAEIVKSPCPSQTCVKTGKISKPGQCAVCLPRRVSVTISGEGAPDGITG